MTPDVVADALTRAGALLGVDRRGHLLSDRVPPALQGLVWRHTDELALHVAAVRSGHRWHRCDTCHRTALRKGQGRGCFLTPRCPGTVARRPAPVDGGLPCARPGCDRPAELFTYTHEALCRADFLHLATILEQEQPSQ